MTRSSALRLPSSRRTSGGRQWEKAMGRKQVVEIQCSRCSRTETQPGELTGPRPAHVFLATLHLSDAPTAEPLTVKFEDLCTPCRRTVSAMLEQIGKRIEG